MKPIPFNNRYVQLGDDFCARTDPEPVADPGLVIFNDALGNALGLPDTGQSAERCAAVFSGNSLPEGAEPVAMAYAGHQFGHFVPQLGDGRALLLGQVETAEGVNGI